MTYRFKKPKRWVKRVFVHCSASDRPNHDNVDTMRNWHKARGWSDVGYHYFIRKSGQLEIGRPIARTPAAQGGKKNLRKGRKTPAGNKGTIAICCHGLKEGNFTESQFETLRDLCHQINDAYDGKVTFHGHREVAYKECPVFDYKAVLGLDDDGRLIGTRSQAPAPLHPGGEAKLHRVVKPLVKSIDQVMQFGSKGWFVKQLQAELNSKQYHAGVVDGHFGKATRNAVAKLKMENGMDTSDAKMPITLRQAREAVAHEPIRETTKMAALRESGSQQIANADRGQIVTVATTAGTVGYNVMPDKPIAEQADEILSKAEEAKGLADRAQDLGGGVWEQISTNANTLLLIVVAAAVTFWFFQRTKQRRLEEARELKNL